MVLKKLSRLISLAIAFSIVGYYGLPVAYAATNANGYTIHDVTEDSAIHRGTSLTVLDVDLLDITVDLTDVLVDGDGVYGFTFGTDTTITQKVAVDTDVLVALAATDNVYWYDADTSTTYNAGDLLWLSQGAENTSYNPAVDGDIAIAGPTTGTVTGVEVIAAGGLLMKYFNEGAAGYSIGEDIFIDSGHTVDAVDLDGIGGDNDVVVDYDGGASFSETGGDVAEGVSGTSALTDFVPATDKIYWFDSAGTFAAWDVATDLIWYEVGGVAGAFEPNSGDLPIAGSNLLISIANAATTEIVDPASVVDTDIPRMAYFDATAGGNFTRNDDDIYLEVTAPDVALTTGRILNGDRLNGLSFNNTAGTAVQSGSGVQDILYVTVYLDTDGSGTLNLGDTSLGQATRLADKQWELNLTSAPVIVNRITPRNRIFVVAQLSQTAINGRTCQFAVEQQTVDAGVAGQFDSGDKGFFFDSSNDGPADAALGNAAVPVNQTIKVYSSPNVANPASPTGITVGNATDTSLTIGWTGPSGVNSFRIFRSTSNTSTGNLIATAIGSSYVDTGLAPGTTYYYIVQSIGSNGMFSTNMTQTAGATTSNGQVVVVPTQPTTPVSPATPTTPGGSTSIVIPTNLPTTMPNGRLLDYRAQWMGQTGTISADKLAHEISGTPGQVLDLELTLRNIGKAPWKADWTDATQWVKLGTWKPQDGTSPFQHSSWLSGNRITVTNVTVNQNGDYTFRFKIQIPTTATVGTQYDFYVRTVSEYVKWFGPTGIFWRVKVV